MVQTPNDTDGLAVFHLVSVNFGRNESGFNVLCLGPEIDMNAAYDHEYLQLQNATFMQVSLLME